MKFKGILAEKLRSLRERHHLTQQELEKKSGVSLRTITNIERGVGGPIQKDTLRNLLSAFELSEGEQQDVVITWLYSEIEDLGENPNKFYLRKSEGMKGNERLLHLFHALSSEEQDQFLKAMERSGLFVDTLKGLNRTWDQLLKEADKLAKKIARGEKRD